ncbi:MAG: IPT/TIG domain-containing protein [Prevotella sp.]|nr:IPT/TIG domain-containing protein [Prevotella sp.]
MKQNLKKMRFPLGIFLASLLMLSLTGCSDSTSNIEDYIGTHNADPYDPSKPVTITGFTPELGGVGQQVIIYGSNFGNDPSLINLTIGGKPAIVVSVAGNALYTFVPSHAFSGKIELTVGEGKDAKTVVCDKNFEYERKMVVGTLCGYKNELDNQGWKEGSFEECCGFRNDGVMQFSPYNHDQLFIVYDQEPYYGTTAHSIQMLDLKERTVKDLINLSKFNNQRLRTIDFAVDPFAYDENGNFEVDEEGNIIGRAPEGWVDAATARQKRWREHLIVSADNWDSNWTADAVYIVDRDRNGDFSSNSPVIHLANYRQCNGASLHPGNTDGKHGPIIDTYSKELYFTSYDQGEIIRLDMDKYWDTLLPTGEVDDDGNDIYPAWDPYVNTNTEAFRKLFTIQDSGWEFQINIHPSGDYAYIVVINQVYILRSDYDWNRRTFLPPYQVAGSMKERGFVDGVGKSAKLARPYQGTFVKNEAYAGSADEYDFYFCDNSWYPNHPAGDAEREAHAIRLLTPEGIVRTYAGGSKNTHADGFVYGSENGELRDVARFDRPTGLVNDVHVDRLTGENTLIFYILDTMNRKIRTITMEEPTDEDLGIVNGDDNNENVDE